MPPDQPDRDALHPQDDSSMSEELRGPDAAPEELRAIYDRLQADARAWSATVASDAPLVGYIRSLPHPFSQESEEAAAMSTPRVDMDHPGPATGPTSGPTVEAKTPALSHGGAPGGGFLRGRTLPTIAAILVVALLAGALYARSVGHGKGSTGATPTATTARPTPTSAPTAIPTIALPPSGQGWTKAGPAYFYGTVAVAPSQPTTLYSCGQSPSSTYDPSAPSFLGVSHDGGKTWTTSPLPAYCATLQVSPTNAQDVAFAGTVCGSASSCPAPSGAQSWVYLSTDGGATWAHATLPPNAVDAAQVLGYFIAWTGTTLFVAPDLGAVQQTIPPGIHILAASANGGSFAWVDQNGLSTQVQNNAQIDLLTGVGDTLYVNYGVDSPNGNCVDPRCSGVATTADGGATWASLTYTYQGAPLVVTTGMAGRNLVAHPRAPSYITGPLLRSTDGGATWSALPTLPNGLSPQDTATFETPDGTLFASTDTSPKATLKLPSGAAAWTLIAPPINDLGSGDLAAVSWDANGHPLALWAPALGEGLFSHRA